jgi:hypothetical protein
MFMKTFEEKFTAWLDGELSFDEAQAFEKEHPSIHEERAGLLKLKLLLKQGLESHVLEHPDFFNSQIMDQIRATRGRSLRKGWLGLPRIAWGGIGALALGLSMFATMIPHGDLSDPRSGYVADALKAKTSDHKIKATADNQKDVTTPKLEQLQKTPAAPAQR